MDALGAKSKGAARRGSGERKRRRQRALLEVRGARPTHGPPSPTRERPPFVCELFLTRHTHIDYPMAPRFIASLDQGTTSTRCILFDASGSVVSSAQREHRQIFPSSGLVEHDPEEIWARTNDVIVEALRIAGAAPTDLAALGITNQRETLIVWNRDTGRAYHNAIVWQDVRGAALCASLAAAAPGGTGRFRAQTGLPLVPYFTASKLAWCLDNVPGLRAAAVAGEALAGTIDSFLTWRLTRSGIAGAAPPLHITDVTNASRTLLFNIHSLEWDLTLCNAFNVPRTMLPRVLPSRCVWVK